MLAGPIEPSDSVSGKLIGVVDGPVPSVVGGGAATETTGARRHCENSEVLPVALSVAVAVIQCWPAIGAKSNSKLPVWPSVGSVVTVSGLPNGVWPSPNVVGSHTALA